MTESSPAQEPRKLTEGEKHFLRLIVKGGKEDGWAPCSVACWPLVKAMPFGLVECEPFGEKYRARLTAQGQSILDAMEWL